MRSRWAAGQGRGAGNREGVHFGPRQGATWAGGSGPAGAFDLHRRICHEPAVAFGSLWRHAVLAAGPTIDVQWSGPTACESAPQLAEQVAVLVGASSEPGPVAVRVEVAAEGPGLRLRLELGVAGREPELRTFVGDDCADLSRTVALLVAIAIDPVRTSSVVVPPPPPVASFPAASSALAPSPSMARPRPAVGRGTPRWRGSLGAAIGAGFGLQPGVAPVFAIRGGASRGRLRLEALARASTPTAVGYPDREGLEGRFVAWGAGARVCIAPAVGRVSLPTCGGATAGAVHARGIAIERARRTTTPWLAANIAAGVRVALGRSWRAVAGLDAEIPLLRHGYHFDEQRPTPRAIYQTAPVALWPWLGVEVEFP